MKRTNRSAGIHARTGRLCILLLLSVASTITAPTETVSNLAIIANPDLPAEEISADDLKSVFLGIKTSLKDGGHLKPVLEKSGPAHAAFLRAYLGKTDAGLQTYYRSLVFSGKWSMPTTLRTDAEVVAYVKKTHGAIGYVEASAVSDSVKTLQVR